MVLDFIEKYKFAILGTVIFHVLVFIYTNFVTVKNPVYFADPQVEMDIPLDDVPLDPEIMELIKPKQQDNLASQEVYNVTSDANDKREKSYENFSTQQMDEQVMENARALEQQYFQEWAGTHPDNQSSSMDITDDKEEDKKKLAQSSPDKSIDQSGDKAFAGEVMASFNLKDRKAHSLEKPGYTCNSSGTVVLEIKVDKNGEVKDVSYMASGSSNATECMIEQSIKYARRSRFNFSSTAPAMQTGTITYKFVAR